MIVVTTPTGAIGRQVLTNLLRAGAPLRLIARDPSRIPPAVRERVEIVEGSHGDAAVVDQAFEGADAVFWLIPPDPRAANLQAAYVDFTRPAATAIRSHRVGRVVAVSALGGHYTGNAGLVSATLAADDLIMSTGTHFRALAMPSFMENLLRQVEAIRSMRTFFSPIHGDLRAPTCATRDIAALATRLLLDPSWRGQSSVPVLGPEDLSFNQMAGIMSQVLGKRITYQQIPFDAYSARLTEAGMSPAMVQGMVDMMTAKNEGLDNAQPRTPEGTTPTRFRHWCREVLGPALRS